MKLLVGMLLCGFMTAYGSSFAQRHVTMSLQNASLQEIFREVTRLTGYDFVYSSTILREVDKMNVEVKEMELEKLLEMCLRDTKLGYKIEDTYVIISPQLRRQEQPQKSIVVKGTVKDAGGTKLPGVTILIKGTTVGASTDAEGKFVLSLPDKEAILQFSFVGMKNKEVKVSGEKELTIVLEEDVAEMEEVVVTGYLNINRKSFTGNSISVTRDDLLKISPSNIIQSLQVFDPSLRIEENSEMGSDPNTLPEFYIRGRSGIGVKELDKSSISRDALQNNPNLPIFIMDGFEVNVEKVYDFDPNRIESINILKDAAATAMYGSRAANGVVVITTRAPKSGEVRVNYNFTGSITSPYLKDYNLMNAEEKLQAEVAAGLFSGGTPEEQYQKELSYYNKLAAVRSGVNTDWLAQPVHTVFNHKHNLYVEGGSQELRYGITLGGDWEDGVMKESYRNRLSAGLALEYRTKVFQIKNNFTYSTMKARNSSYGSFSEYAKKNPYDAFKDEEGNYLKLLKKWDPSTVDEQVKNPLYEATLGSFDREEYDEIMENLNLTWYITDYLNLRGSLNASRQRTRTDRFTDPLSSTYDKLSPGDFKRGDLRLGNNENKSWSSNLSLTFNKVIGRHYFNVLYGLDIRTSVYSTESSSYRGFPSGELYSPNYAYEIVSKPVRTEKTSRMLSSVFSLNYTYDNIYLLDVSQRIDGSSEFGTDKKYAPFWSAGVGLNIHNYAFLKDNKVLSQLKIRGSVGKTGKVNFPAYAAQDRYRTIVDNTYSTGQGVSLMGLGNENLKWETTRILDFGGTLDLCNGAFYLQMSYYNKKTVDLITDLTISSSSGFVSYKDNMGEVSNKGIELSFRSQILKRKGIYLSVFGNLSHNKNEILKISDALKAYNERVNSMYNQYDLMPKEPRYSQPYMKYVEGGSLTSLFAMKSLGINPANGKEIYLRSDGTVTYDWLAGEQVIVGDREPQAQGSFGFNFSYKGFSIYTTFMYEWGSQRYNQTLVDNVENADVRYYNADRRVLMARWQKPGDVTPLKNISERERTTRPTSRFIQDYNVLTLNALTLGYDFKREWIKKAGLQTLNLKLGMNDVWRLSSVKQERGTTYPYAKKVTITLNVSF